MNKIRSFIRFHLFSVSLREKLLFVRNLAIAVKSGMSLIAGLELIKAQTQSKTMSKILVALMADVQKGMFLSKGMENYPSAFDNIFVNAVKVGDTRGPLHARMLIAMSNGLISYGPLVALGVFVLIVLIWAILKINKVKYVIHYSYFFWPIVRRIVVQTNMANISRTMGIF